ncbi:hexosaminidase D-like isoform X2 [Neocloeon triangulifer]|uniref:hexosaminidase D-like isoform X2 n=1 Tax=Neocloeon triangulifer TaxID=2078957 RepID=UPI00286F2B43|nr:hexosaminidase D-like isoform X2 [Neocloeon triangulifer]
MSAATAFAGRLGLSAWRRRSTWLGLVLLFMLLLVCLQFYSGPGLFSPADQKVTIEHKLNKGNLIKDGVEFLRSDRKSEISTPYFEDEMVQKNFEEEQRAANNYWNGIPSRDDIYGRRQHQDAEENVTSTSAAVKSAITAQSTKPATSQTMGIARVALNPKNPYVPPHRLVHFDLKGAPPKASYLLQVLPIFKQQGATGVLLEWEDMFPFKDSMAKVAATNHYSTAEVTQILQKCKELGLEVIPLVQTFGHLEFVLKIEQFSNLREVAEIPQALCPSKNSSFKMVTKLLHQVYELHSTVMKPKYMHIGCDEVFTMGECNLCRRKARDDVFLDHVARVASFVRSQYNVTPIIWDDMLRHLQPDQLRKIGDLGVEPMVWVYAENVYHFVQPSVWEKYAGSFRRAWTASAFKGAFGETINVPNAKRHLDNNLRWLEVMTNENRKFREGFSGIAVTGWQRYDHFATLCELLPSGLPSLALDMLATSHGYFNHSLRPMIDSSMNCPSSPRAIINMERDSFLWERFSGCAFPGATVFRLMSRLEIYDKEYDEFMLLVRKKKAWLTEYNVRHNFTTPLRLNELMQDHSRMLHSALSLSKQARDALSEVFDEHTVGEWLEQKMQPYVESLEKLGADTEALRRRMVWPVRPLPLSPTLKRLGFDPQH